MRRLLTALSAVLVLWAQIAPAAAQSRLRDAETEAVLNDMARPIIVAAGLAPASVHIVLIQDPEINAFVAGGQIVYLHSALIEAADSANEVQGVIAHELGHVTGGHIVRMSEGMASATGISLLSLALGIAAIAAGAGEAGAGIMAAGQQAAMGRFLAFSRTQEASADAAGAKYLRGAGISGKGIISFFKKLQQIEYRLAIKKEDAYNATHPLSGQRVANLTQELEASPNWNTPTDPALEARFQRVRAKLIGYTGDPRETLVAYPPSDRSQPARYARAYAYHKSGFPQEAAAEAQALVSVVPDDPYYLELQGQVLLESGKPGQALVPLRRATQLSRSDPLIATTFGHALLATEDRANLPEAERVLRTSIGRDDENPYAWYQLGTLYERTGDTARVALANAERSSMTGDPGRALANARAAMAGLPRDTPDWIRAQDIAMVSQTAVEDARRRR